MLSDETYWALVHLDHISPIYTLKSYHSRTKIYTGITPMPCLDTKTMTQHLAPFDRINLGHPLAEVDRAI